MGKTLLAVLASSGPIVVFFALSTKSYPFMVLLNVATGTVAGVLGLGFLLRTLGRLVIVQEDIEISNFEASLKNGQGEEAKDKKIEPTGALDRMGKVTSHKVKICFQDLDDCLCTRLSPNELGPSSVYRLS